MTTRETIIAHTEEAQRALSKLEKEQFPFAFAQTITQLGTGAVKVVQLKTKSTYNLKSKFIPNNIKRTIAKKSQVKSSGKASSVVFSTEKIAYMTKHEEGGTFTPTANSGGKDKGKAFTIPSHEMKHKIRTSTGRVKKRFKPQNLLTGKQKANNNQKRGRSRRKKPFIIRSNSGVAMIVRRTHKRRKPLKIIYIFADKARYAPTWGFEPTVEKYVRRAFPALMKRNLRLALRSAK